MMYELDVDLSGWRTHYYWMFSSPQPEQTSLQRMSTALGSTGMELNVDMSLLAAVNLVWFGSNCRSSPILSSLCIFSD